MSGVSHGAVSRKTFPCGAFLSTLPCFPDLILFIEYLIEGHSEMWNMSLKVFKCMAQILSLVPDPSVCVSVHVHRGCGYYVRDGVVDCSFEQSDSQAVSPSQCCFLLISCIFSHCLTDSLG